MNKKYFQIITLTAAVLLPLLFGIGFAYADILDPMSDTRTKFSLNGSWKFSSLDRTEFSQVSYNDSKWGKIDVPGDWSDFGIRNNTVTWYRKKFNLPANSSYDLIRFEQILDAGEIWINGSKLINPIFQPPLESVQPGVFMHVWTFRWPYTFNCENLLKPGKENIIAVRVTSDPLTRGKEISYFNNPAFTGSAGVTGGVYLIGRPLVFIRSIQRRAPTQITGGNVEHNFFVFINNSGLKTAQVDVSFAIKSARGKELFRKSTHIYVSSSGEIAQFTWKTRPRFEKYTAATYISSGTSRDFETLTFHGTIVHASKKSIEVNGAPFIVKGMEGIPGLLSNAVRGNGGVLSASQISDEINRLKHLGINTLRLTEPAPPVIEEAMNHEMMVIPVIDSDWARTVIALKEYPNILYWDIPVNESSSLYSITEEISGLDSYKRPIGYSGNLKVDTRQSKFRYINIISMTLEGNGSCGNPGPETRLGMPVVFTGWGGGSGGIMTSLNWYGTSYYQLWHDCVESGAVRGIVYSGLIKKPESPLALREASSLNWNPVLKELLEVIFQDFDIEVNKDENTSRTAVLKYTGKSPIESLQAFTLSGRTTRPITSKSTLKPGQEFRFNIPQNMNNSDNILISCVYNGGITGETTFSPFNPALSPDRISFTQPAGGIKTGKNENLKVTVAGWKNKRTVEVSLEENSSTVDVTPGSRTITIPAGGKELASFKIKIKKGGVPVLITATVKFTDGQSLPLKSYLLVKAE